MSEFKKKVSFHTLGCKLNFSETSTIARQFEQGGFVRALKGERADVCVVNTCSVTEHADKKCRNIVRKLIKENPDAIIAVTGCYAQLKPEDIAAIEGVDIVVGNNDKGDIFGHVAALGVRGAQGARGALGTQGAREAWGAREARGDLADRGDLVVLGYPKVVHSCSAEELTGFFEAFSSGDRTRSFLKVQDGCDYHCSYCTIPLARGASRNMPISNIVAAAEKIEAAGQKEIVLTGINTGDFGQTTGERFLDLLVALDSVEGIERYRISSIEPNLLSDEIIAFSALSKKFQPHFHIPIQSGCDRILALMRRRYTTGQFAQRIEAVLRQIPGVFLGIDVIVGFPGETDNDFEQTFSFLSSINPAFLHIFPYSARAGTPAADFEGRVSPTVVAERVRRLSKLSTQFYDDFCIKHIGSRASVLWESSRRGGEMSGYTENYIKVAAPYDKDRVNKVTQVRLLQFGADKVMRGEII